MVEEILERVELQSAGSMDQVSTVICENSFFSTWTSDHLYKPGKELDIINI